MFATFQIVNIIFAIMAGILHLSNIEFAPDPELQQLIIVNEDEVDYGKLFLFTSFFFKLHVIVC